MEKIKFQLEDGTEVEFYVEELLIFLCPIP